MQEFEGKYYHLLREKFPTRDACRAEIIRLNARLNMPKGTEHFLSDLHGEWEAFSHLRSNASGAVLKKIREVFNNELSEGEMEELAMLIYYPDETLEARENKELAFFENTVKRLVGVIDKISAKYTLKALEEQIERVSGAYAQTVKELVLSYRKPGKEKYTESIIKSGVRIGGAEKVIIALSSVIKSLIIERLHVVGDIFDRGSRPDLILDELMKERSIDVEWGNHDVLWMGAAAGSPVCIATVLNNSMTYKNIDTVEIGYGISLRPLEELADSIYKHSDVTAFLPKRSFGGDNIGSASDERIARMHKAICVIQFKLECEVIRRNPSFLMESRLILEQFSKERGTVIIDEKEYNLLDSDFPTLLSESARLTEEEERLIGYLKIAFTSSEKLNRHIRFLYEVGGMYKIFNSNLLFHGSVPMTEDGDFMKLDAAGGLSGRALLDYCDKCARQGYFAKRGSEERRHGEDFLWFLWCGRYSPLSGRERIATFERLLISDEATHNEPKNAYYKAWESREIAEKILREFGLTSPKAHIINGHIPINKGEDPVKGGGRLIVIDGGFCKAFHDKTGIGGYTLIYNSEGMTLTSHKPFLNRESAIKDGGGIISGRTVYEHKCGRMLIRECDEGEKIREEITSLMLLISAYESGIIKESGAPK